MPLSATSKILFTVFLFCWASIPYAVEKVAVIALFKNQAVLQIDGKQRKLKVGKTSPEGVKLIAADSEKAVLEIDGQRRTMKLGTRISNRFKASTGGTILTIAPDSRGMYFVNGSINGFQVNFLVDTGATNVVMNRNVAKRIGLNYKLNGQKSRASTANGVVDTYLVRLKKVKIGDIEVRDVVGSVNDSDFPDIILLGNSFLNKVDSQREGRVLKLKQ